MGIEIPMQTLQIYRKVEVVPAEVRVLRLKNELETIKKEHSFLPPLQNNYDNAPKEPERIRTHELQNIETNLERELSFWDKDYRSMIAQICELERAFPKNDHNVEESDDKAHENVEKIKIIKAIKEHLLAEFRDICIRHEKSEERSRKRIKRLEQDLAASQREVVTLECKLNKLQK